MTFFTRDAQVSPLLEFSLKTADLEAQLLLSCAHYLPQGGGGEEDLAPFFFTGIHKVSTRTLSNMEERPI